MNTFAKHARNNVFCTLMALPALCASARAEADYIKDVKPLLRTHCFECHGALKQKAGLRLDTAAAMRKGGESGNVIAGDRAALLLERIASADKEIRMPPEGSRLSVDQIATLKTWIAGGAKAPEIEQPEPDPRLHWAFQPVRSTGGGDRIDFFISARLAQEGLALSPPADKRTLIRRATFDLTGLPPSAEEVDAFVKNTTPDAFAKVVDRLLASPHYGEHWARHWLDVARYSDTKGYVYAREEKYFVHAWPYRDWVVRALNEDMSYDRFLLLQLAADQLEPAGAENLAAMGFLTLGRRFLGVTHDIIDDRIDVTLRGTQALTVACARCHDHKFDPISTRDYYALYGVFQSCAEQLVPCGKTQTAPSEAFAKELNLREKKLREMMAKRREEQSARVRGTIAEHLLAQFELEKYPEETFNQILGDADINPVFVRRWQSFLDAAAKRGDPIFTPWIELAKLNPDLFAAEAEKVLKNLKSIHPTVAQAFATAPANRRDAAARYAGIFAAVEKQWRELLKTDKDAKALPDADTEALRNVLYGPNSPCCFPSEHIASNEIYFPTKVIEELWKLQGEVDRWLIQSPGAPPYATILADREPLAPPRVFKRGNPLTKGEEVTRQFLPVLSRAESKPFANGSGRLELAQAITDRRNPLTARVMVNRVWMYHFGRGLVGTPSDFGTRAEPPTHPELLDSLAQSFMDDGWSLKRLHRRIMLSASYQQGSLALPNSPALAKAQEKDPDNRLLWRMNTHRLSLEEMRDAWLAATGELDRRVGGKPEELFAKQNVRRTLYSVVDRERLASVMCVFDFANPDLSISQRTDTIVPQQALFGLNHPFVGARAKALMKRIEALEIKDDAERVRQLYALLLQRTPTARELDAALAFLKTELDSTHATPATANRSEAAVAWQYGYGEFDEATGHLKSFTPLPHLTGAGPGVSAWQGGENWPDAKLGWLQLTAAGGHPGNDRQHAVARRWIAPKDGSYAVTSTLVHEPSQGDGVRAFISHNGKGLVGSAKAHASKSPLNVESIAMNKGDTLDFIVDIGGSLNSNQFLWSPKIACIGGALSWDAQTDFTEAKSTTLRPWDELAQILMLTNEFLFVD